MRQLTITRQITNRKDHCLDKYLQDINRIPMISAETEAELTQKIKQGDQKALNLLIESNLRFVVSVAKQYQHKGLTLSDLINEGNLGLMKAAMRFDETRGFKFISYAVWWIRQGIAQAITDNSRIVRLPLNKISIIGKINRASLKLQQQLQRKPSVEELAQFLNISEKEIENCLQNSERNLSLDMPFNDGEPSTLYTTIACKDSPNPEGNMLKASLTIDINRILKILSDREKQVIVLLFGLQHTAPQNLEEIGETLQLTRERVRQIKVRAISKLQGSNISLDLIKYLG
ncbi:RNA polymerase sigma factor RpoD [Neptunitalea chrysea]|uniref:RNA polymerase sigma factor RpoD n=1 Tax=Neptunitalea chrysea TaxID=1647581 RepID=A0A9W6EW62_9FLAO|nr:RNA polymerase sigma factor RpoD/SigA [Neptunitalea chrysea]GLB52478.1 RNA polymerase sigma factor RpoD [Neptunitalea chrysea]